MGTRPVERSTAPPAAKQQAQRADRRPAARQAPSLSYVDIMKLQLGMLLADNPNAAVSVVVSPETVDSLLNSIQFLLKEGVRYIVLVPDTSEPWPEEAIEALQAQSRVLAHFYAAWTDTATLPWPIALADAAS